VNKTFVIAILLALVSAACTSGPIQVRLQQPSLQIESLRAGDDRVHLGLLLHNPNDHAILVEGLQAVLEIDGMRLLERDWMLGLAMDPRGRERLNLQADVQASALQALREFQASGARTVPYRLRAEIQLRGQRNGRVEQPGFLHPVPGQPGNFR